MIRYELKAALDNFDESTSIPIALRNRDYIRAVLMRIVRDVSSGEADWLERARKFVDEYVPEW